MPTTTLATAAANATDAPKSQVIILASLGNERLAVYGCFLVLRLHISTQKYRYDHNILTLLDFIWYEGQ